MDKTNNITDNLFKHLEKLNEGIYTNNDIIIKKLNTKDGFSATLNIGNNIYQTHYSYSGEYYITTKIDNFAEFSCSKNFANCIHNYIHVEIDNQKYNIYNNGITKKEEKTNLIENDELIKEINENTYLGYNLKNHKIYVYFKKYNIKENDNKNKKYFKYEYDKTILEEINLFNKKIDKTLSRLKNDIDINTFKDLAETINIRHLNTNIPIEKEKLKKLAVIYNNYANNLTLTKYEKDFNTIIEFTNKLLENPYDAKENSVKNFINNINLKDSNQLKELKQQINDLIKLQKSNTKTKTK